MPGNVKFEGSGLKPEITKRAWVGEKRLLEVIRVDIKTTREDSHGSGVIRICLKHLGMKKIF